MSTVLLIVVLLLLAIGSSLAIGGALYFARLEGRREEAETREWARWN